MVTRQCLTGTISCPLNLLPVQGFSVSVRAKKSEDTGSRSTRRSLIGTLGSWNRSSRRPNGTTTWTGCAYPFYIIHQTVIIAIGCYVVRLHIGVWPKFLIIAACALAVTLALYHLVIKQTAVTRLLFGLQLRRAGTTKKVLARA